MRFRLIPTVLGVATLAFAPLGATAASDEQLRLLEERMAEMEDRLRSTSEELKEEKKSNQQQRVMLEEAGLVDESDDGVRSKVGKFFELVDVTGVAATSYNHRIVDPRDGDSVAPVSFPPGFQNGARNDNLFTHKNGNTFQVDEIYLTIDKTPTEESRGGFHMDVFYGATAEQQARNTGSAHGGFDTPYLYAGYVSYLAPIGRGVRVDAGRLISPFGPETLQTNKNLNITEGLVFQKMIPFTYTGVQTTTQLTDQVGLILGVANELYTDAMVSPDRDKLGYAQVKFTGDKVAVNVGAAVGAENTTANASCDQTHPHCNISYFSTSIYWNPTDRFTSWFDLNWTRHFGTSVRNADRVGVAAAGRFALTDKTGIGGRAEYLTLDKRTIALAPPTSDRQTMTWTGTLDHKLTDDFVLRAEVRYDHEFQRAAAQFSSGTRKDQLVAIAQAYYAF